MSARGRNAVHGDSRFWPAHNRKHGLATEAVLHRRPGVVIFLAQLAFAAQQAPPNKQATQPASKTPSPFADSQELLQQGKFEDAKIRIQEELQQNPSNAQGYALLGLVYTAEKNYPEALTAFQQGLKLDPKSTGIHNDLGNLYVAQGNLDLAEKEFREVLRLSPADSDGNYNLSLVLLTKKHPADAIPFLQRIHPQTIASRITLTRAYLEAGRTAEGLKAAQELSAQNKENVQVHFTLGVLLAAEKQHRAAQLELEQANVLPASNFRDSLQSRRGLSAGRRICESRTRPEARADNQARFPRDTLSPGPGLHRAAETALTPWICSSAATNLPPTTSTSSTPSRA